MHKHKNILLISFSGIDGAGKSTQISSLRDWLQQAGLTVQILRMWDDIVVASRWRETASRLAFRGDQGIGSPEKPLERRDKNVNSWPARFARFFFYLADALSLRWRIRRIQSSGSQDVLIFDRYIYDELANLPLHQPAVRRFSAFVLKITPQPDLAYVIDAVPEQARSRKPEYPLEFLRANRKSYMAISALSGKMTVIASGSIQEAEESIRASLIAKVQKSDAAPTLAMQH